MKLSFAILSDLRTLYPKILYLELFINLSVVSAMKSIIERVSIRHLGIRSWEHIGVSPFTGKKVKPTSNSSARDHLLHCNYLPSFDNFSLMTHENKKFIRNRRKPSELKPKKAF